MNDKQIDYGQQDDYVKTLQHLLNQNGYNLDEDGIYGEQTHSAVQDYQMKNQPSAGAMAGGAKQGAAPQTAGIDGGFSYGAYTPSGTVQQAQALLQQHMANKPGAFQSQWTDQINGLIDQIMNREAFSYDMNADALYQQYADQYSQQGKMAMMDTMGQAAALTGGYGNSYAQGVGQQAYQGYLQQLNDVMPELYQMAHESHNREGQDLLNQLSVLARQEETEYGRHQDQVSEYYAQLGQLKDDYDAEREFDYGKYADERDFAYDQYQDDLAYDYQVGRDQIEDEQWQKEYEESVRRWNHENGIVEESGDSDNDSGHTGPYVQLEFRPIADATVAGGKNGVTPQMLAAAKETANRFTGSTYNEAVEYMEKNGVTSANAASAMTQSEWQRRRASFLTGGPGGAEVKNYSSYKQYLADYVEYQLSKK